MTLTCPPVLNGTSIPRFVAHISPLTYYPPPSPSFPTVSKLPPTDLLLNPHKCICNMYPSLSLYTLLVATTLASTDFPFATFNSITGLQRRNTCYQQNPTCVSCFGAGSIECVDASSCYNPTQGETCCSNSGP